MAAVSRATASLLAGLGLGLVACAPALRPVASSAAPASPAIAYSFELLEGSPRRVRVELTVQGERDERRPGESLFAVAPGWGGVNDVAGLLHGLQARDVQGAELPLERSDDTHWIVRSASGAELRLSWELHALEQEQITPRGNEYRPVVTDALFHAIGETCLVWPEWMETPEERDIALAWRGFGAAGWTVACSHGAAQDELMAHRSLQGFRHAVFVAGAGLRLDQRRVGEGVLATAILGDGWTFRDAEFDALVERIIAAERDFFADPGPAFYLVTLFPTPPMPKGGFSLGGTALTDSFALFVMDGIGLEPESDERLRVARVLAHEHFHAWNGGRLQPEEPEQLGYWFSEGFTEFYTGRVLLAAGLITPEQRVAGLNEMLQAYWSSPVRNAPASRIVEDFWTDPDVQKLPYQRGELVAILADDAIRRGSAGQLSLDDFMRDLVEQAPGTYSTESMLARLQEWTDPELAQRLRAIVVDGADAVLPPGTWSPWVRVGSRQSATFELGFDREATMSTGLVSGVRDGSAAWTAGLRNGQHATNLSLGPPVATSSVTLTIRDQGGTRDVTWLPAGEPVELPILILEQAGEF